MYYNNKQFYHKTKRGGTENCEYVVSTTLTDIIKDDFDSLISRPK